MKKFHTTYIKMLPAKSKILFVIPNLKLGGGGERVTSLWAKGLSKRYDVHILTFEDYKNKYDFKGNYISLKENSNFFKKILRINSLIRPIKLFKYIKQISPNLIISVMDYSNLILIITKILFWINIPLLISIHCNPKFQYKEKRYMLFLIKLLYRLKVVNKIITLSNGIKKILIEELKIDSTKIETIYSGVDNTKIREDSKDIDIEYHEIFNNENFIKFINVARLSKEKGHIYLIKAFKKVKKELPNSKLFILGGGNLKNELKSLISKLNLEKDVYLIGIQENPFKYINKADIFVFSSLYEALPTVLLEALSLGIPIISTNCKTGPNEILDNGKYGFLANVGDVNDLADKMIFLGKNPNLIKYYSKMSLERSNFFTLNKSIKKLEKLIENVLSNNLN